MPYWEYKVITSGKGGFATPALLEKFLNDLGRDEWEIIHYQSPADNPLAFTGLARRSTQRDWTLEDAAAAAAKVEAEKLRAEFEAKFKAASSPGPEAVEESAPSFLEEKTAPEDGLRKLVDTSHDDEPEALEDEKADEWDKLIASEEELPTFFEAIRPHMRRNQRGPGMSVGVDYLAKKWDLSEDDLKGALVECGFNVPADEDAPVEYLEYDGDLYWLNINRRGELWINTKEKPRPVFRPVKATRLEPEAPKTEAAAAAPEATPTGEDGAAAEGTPSTAEGVAAVPEGAKPTAPALPEGVALLEKIRPHMRRNRRGPGGSGSMNFLSRALRTKEAELKSAFAALGLTIPAASSDKPVYTEIGNELWWLNLDSRGGLWINGREKKEGETAATTEAPAAPPAPNAAARAGEIAPVPTETPATVPTAGAAEAAPPPAATIGAEAALPPAPPGAEPAAAAAPPALPTAFPAEAVPEPSVYDAITMPPMGFPSMLGRAAPPAEPAPAAAPREPAPAEPVAPSAPVVAGAPLAAVRLLLKETRTGAIAGRIERLASEMGRPVDELVAALVAAGLKVPEKLREKPVFVEHAGEILWFNRNAKGELWLNAKASKFAAADQVETEEDDTEAEEPEGGADDGEKKASRRGGRSRGKKAD